MKRNIYILLVALLCLSTTGAKAQFSGGSGTAADPWQIASPTHLNKVRDYLGTEKHFVLIADISLFAYLGTEEANPQGWQPIGTYISDNTQSFTGSFDGRGHTISGLRTDRTANFTGLFGRTYKATISNLTIVTMGGVSGGSFVGCLTGEAVNSVITNCHVNGSVRGTDIVGGLAGKLNEGAHVTNSSSVGTVIGNDNIGGLVGLIDGGSGNNLVSECFSTGTVLGNGGNIGGLVGIAYSGSNIVNKSYATGNVSGSNYVGGLVGSNQQNVAWCYATGRVTSSGTDVGGFFGYNNNSGKIVEANYFDTQATGKANAVGDGPDTGISGKTTAEMKTKATFTGWDFTNTWSMPSASYPALKWQGIEEEPEEDPVMTFTTTQIGSFTFTIEATAENTPVKVDWGDGVKQSYTIGTSGKDNISGTTIGSGSADVKIYGTGIQLLNLGNKKITDLDVSKNTTLVWLFCNDNQLTTLDVSKNTALIQLNCEYNQLTTLDVSKNTALTHLQCYLNQLTSLDVNKNTELILLDCSSNQLTTLDVSKNTALAYLYCSGNQLTLSDLYPASQKISDTDKKHLGEQQPVLFTEITLQTNNPLDLSSQKAFGSPAVNTVFVVKKGAATAVENTDYTINQGIITFKTTGTYTVEMTNSAITSHPDYPAKAITGNIKVEPGAAQPTAITGHPEGALICQGSNHTFRVTAQGDNLVYQWHKDGNPIAGTNVPEYTIANATSGDAGDYSVAVTGDDGQTKTSNAAGLSVADPLPATPTFSECPNPAITGKTYTIKLAGYPNVTSYTWSYSKPGVTFSPASGPDNETSATFSVAAAGTGTLSVTLTHICGNRTAEQTIDVQYPTGLDDVKASGISLFPNPTADVVTVHGTQSMKSGIRIFTITGSLMGVYDAQDGKTQIDCSRLSKGAYLLCYKGRTMKLIKK